MKVFTDYGGFMKICSLLCYKNRIHLKYPVGEALLELIEEKKN
jgi:hypothetical protein